MNPNKLFLFSLIFFILVIGCNAPAALTAQPPAPVSTPVLSTSIPTISNTPAPTQASPLPNTMLHPPLSTNGPYLAYQDQVGNQPVIKLLDADGMGQNMLFYPSNAAPLNLNLPFYDTLSPDGKWMAYYSGSAGSCFGEVGPVTADLTLNLMSLADGTIKVVTPLLSKDYPNNFAKAAQQLGQADVTAEMLQNAFICGITQSLDWSPDGRYLAFAGQMDGLSSDLYLYDSFSGALNRLSSGPEEVQWISWSPDGKWILDGSSYSVGEGMQYNIYSTSLDGTSINQLSRGTPKVVTYRDWLDDQTYFDTNGGNGPGCYDLKLVNVDTGKTSEIWKGSYGPFAFVPYGHWIALFANTPTWPYPYNDSDFQTGIFLIDTTSLKQSRVNSLGSWGCCSPPSVAALGHTDAQLFLVNGGASHQVEYLSSDGKLTSTSMQADRISVSPDSLKWIAIGAKIQIFSDNGSLIHTVDLPAHPDLKNIGSIYWQPDSSGLFFTYKDSQKNDGSGKLYFLELANGDPVQVDSLSPASPENFFWVTGPG